MGKHSSKSKKNKFPPQQRATPTPAPAPARAANAAESVAANPARQVARTTIAQKRAKHALERINGYKEKGPEEQKRFNAYVSSLGPMILMNGLGQACAFYHANKKAEHQDVLNMLDNWLTQQGRPLHALHARQHLVERIVELDVKGYRLAQAESLAYLDWLKKFAKSFLRSEGGGHEPATL